MPFQSGSRSSDISPSRERRIALVIGNSRYRHASELANPVNDAEAMAAVLARLGFDVVKGIDLDLQKMGDVHAAFGAKLRGKPDVVLLFYAGHGLQVKGLNYLVPVDAQIDVPEHLNSRAIRFNDIFDPMTEGAAASLIFLDACRDNPFTRNLARSLGESTRGAIRGGLAKVEKVTGSFIAYATAPDEVAFDGKSEHSPFTAALLRYIETAGLSVSDMMIDVRNAVLAETHGRQEPWDQSSLRARFCFVPKIEEARTEEATKRVQLSPSADEWAAVQNTTSLAVLARFKERHPDWSEYADIRMKELREVDEKRRSAGPPAGAGMIAAAFIALVLIVQIILGGLFSESEWNWVRANSAHDGGMATGFLLAFVLAVVSAGALVYRRRGNLSSMEISLYWLGCMLASLMGIGYLFFVKDWSWLGTSNIDNASSATGLLVVLVLALASAATLVYRRRGRLTGVEIGAYWFGCSLVFVLASVSLFLANDFHFSVGLLVGFAIPFVSGAALAYWWRTHNKDNPDIGGGFACSDRTAG